MEVRAAETAAAPVVQAEAAEAVAGGDRARVTANRRPMARPAILTREQEYHYIRADLRRLIVTAGSLLVLMVVLLVVIE